MSCLIPVSIDVNHKFIAELYQRALVSQKFQQNTFLSFYHNGLMTNQLPNPGLAVNQWKHV